MEGTRRRQQPCCVVESDSSPAGKVLKNLTIFKNFKNLYFQNVKILKILKRLRSFNSFKAFKS